MVVIGAGAIGLELGSVWARLGTAVTVVEFLPRIASTFDEDITQALQKLLQRQGLKFHLGTYVESAEKTEGGVKLTAAKGDKKLEFEAEKLLVAVGRKPNTEGLGTAEAGVELDERGCIVAELGRYREDEPFRCCQILRESTVDSTADRLAILAEEVSARVAEPAAPAARIRGRVYGDAVANSDRLHARADFYHVTGDLVTERHRRLEAVAAVTYVQIRSADPGSSYGDLDGVVSGYLGFWYLAQLNPA